MTNREMVDIYLASREMRLVQGSGTLEPILPVIMLDAQYQLYLSEIKNIPVGHELKLWRNRWQWNYNAFNREFFRVFNVDQQIEVTDKMDSFEKYIANDVMIAKVQIMNFLNDLEFEQAKTCASLMLCNILAQSAGIVWAHVYKDSRHNDTRNPYISAIEKCSSKFMNLYHRAISERNVNPNQSKQIVDAVQVLCDKMIGWLYKDRDESQK